MADGDPKVPNRRVTIKTVATEAGVSVAAVSKVLRNAYGVSEALRERVEASILRLGYRPSVAARGMRGRTFTLGVLLVGIDNPFLPGIFRGIESITEAAGYKIMVGVGAARTPTEVRLIEQMIDNRMDGLILVATQIAGETLEHFARQIPIVVIGHHEPLAVGYDTVNNNDRGGAHLAVRALIAKGYKDIAMITLADPGDHPADVAPQRELGYLDAMAEGGVADQARVIRLPQFDAPRNAAIHQILTAADRPRAVFCWSDLDAVPLIDAAFRLGLRVPHDLAIVGYDNSPITNLSMIDMASVDQDGPQLGQLSAEALFSRISGRTEARHILIEPKLIARNSF
jgi:LacI family transcriptional regulator